MLFVCLTYVCIREPYCGGKFRENVGKALWGQKWDRVLDGGPDADKIEVTNSIPIRVTSRLIDYSASGRFCLFSRSRMIFFHNASTASLIVMTS